MTPRQDGDFEMEDHDWQRIAAAGGLSPHDLAKRYTLDAVIEGWLREVPPEKMRANRAKTGRVVEAVRNLLRVIEETGRDLHLTDSQMLSEVIGPLVDEWDSVTDEVGRYNGRGHLQDELCVLWRLEWELPLAASVDPTTGDAGGPLVRFLMTVHDCVIEEPLTSHQARHAIRKMRRLFRAPPSDEDIAADLDASRAALDDLLRSSNGELDS